MPWIVATPWLLVAEQQDFTNDIFLLDVAITNSYVLMKDFSPECPFSNYKICFRLQLAKELVGD